MRAGLRQQALGGFGDVAAGLQVGGADLVLAEAVGAEVDAGAALDLGLHLDLPLVVDPEALTLDHAEQGFRRRLHVEDVLVAAEVRQPVRALGGGDDRAALGDDLVGGRDALDRLVEVLVERVAAVRG